jgi:hypothetical protein
MILLLTQMFFCLLIHVFLQLRWVWLLGRKKVNRLLEKSKLWEKFLSKTYSILRVKQCATFCSFYHRWFSFEWYKSFFKWPEQGNLEQTQPNVRLNNLSSSKFSSQKLIQFSLRNNVLDDPASSTDDFLSIDTYISSTMLNSLFGTKRINL